MWAGAEKKKRGRGGPLGWKEGKGGFGVFFLFLFLYLKTHKVKQKHATTNDAQALG
jgi:hypothetical protein